MNGEMGLSDLCENIFLSPVSMLKVSENAS